MQNERSQISVQLGRVHNPRAAGGVVAYIVETDEWVVLAPICADLGVRGAAPGVCFLVRLPIHSRCTINGKDKRRVGKVETRTM
jgi:hypothetical protein